MQAKSEAEKREGKMSVPDKKLSNLEEMQQLQLRSYKSEVSDWHLPPGSPTAIIMAARSIYKDEPETLARFEKEYADHVKKHNEEKPGTWWKGVWYDWDFEFGYPWSNTENAYKYY